MRMTNIRSIAWDLIQFVSDFKKFGSKRQTYINLLEVE